MEKNTDDIYPQWVDFLDALGRFCTFLEDAAEESPLQDWHVVFNMGTVIRVCARGVPGAPNTTGVVPSLEEAGVSPSAPAHVTPPAPAPAPAQGKFNGYDGRYLENWPQEKLEAGGSFDGITLEEILASVNRVWEIQSKIPDVKLRDIISRSYYILLTDGYPLPGNLSERSAIPLECPPEDTDSQQTQNDLPAPIDILWGVIWKERDPAIINLAIDDDVEQALATAGELRRLDFMFPKIMAIISPDLECYLIGDIPAK